jgi:hypothetical protein
MADLPPDMPHMAALLAALLSLLMQEEAGGVLVLARDKLSMEVLNHAGGEINNALTNPFFGVL